MVTREQVIEWLEKSYLKNLEEIPEDVLNLIAQSFRAGTGISVTKNLEQRYIQLWEALARAFVAGIKMGQVPEHSNLEDLEDIMKNNPEGIKKGGD